MLKRTPLDHIAVIGGADPADPRHPDDRTRHLAVGLLIGVIAVWAFIGGTHLGTSALHLNLPAALILGALLASITTLSDTLVSIVALDSSTTLARLRVLAARALLSVGMGLVVGYVALLAIYAPTIDRLVSMANQAKADAIAKTYTARSPIPGQIAADNTAVTKDNAELTSDASQQKAADAALAAAQDAVTKAREAWLGDTLPCTPHSVLACNGDYAGTGGVSGPLRDGYQHALTVDLPAAQSTHQATVTTLADDVTTLRKDVKSKQDQVANLETTLAAQVLQAQQTTLADKGIPAQDDALAQILTEDKIAWLWPVFFLVVDLSVAMTRAVLPESRHDRLRHRRRELDAMLEKGVADAPEMADLRAISLQRTLDVEKARIDADANRQLASINTRHHPFRTSSPRSTGRRRSRRPVVIAVAALTAVALAGYGLHAVTQNTKRSQDQGASSAQPSVVASPNAYPEGQLLSLGNGMSLNVPRGAISNDQKVTGTITAGSSWASHTAVTSATSFTTAGKVIGAPILSWHVPTGLVTAAQQGDIQLAFASTAVSGWTPYPATYDSRTHTMSARLSHFSNWRFWTWDWPSIGARVSQDLGELAGRRASGGPDCTSGIPAPDWYNTSAGIIADAGQVVRACVEGHAGDDQLVVQMVNNRPYGLLLHYSGQPVGFGWHETASALTDALRDAVAETGAGPNGLYLPPLSRASVGIKNPGPGKYFRMSITPTGSTLAADLLSFTAGDIIDTTVSNKAMSQLHDRFAAAAAGSCSDLATSYNFLHVPERQEAISVLTGAAPRCLRDLLIIMGRNEVAQGADGMSLATLQDLSSKTELLRRFMDVDKAVTIENNIGDVLDFFADAKTAAVPDLGFGFSVLSHAVTSSPLSTPADTPPLVTPPTLPAPSTAGAPSSTLPPALLPLLPKSNTATPSPPSSTPSQHLPHPSQVIDNYGEAVGAGFPMCRGNQGGSTPGGIVTQTFTVPPDTATIDAVTVQVDADALTTVHAQLLRNGVELSGTQAAASSGDVNLSWPSTPVTAGENLTLALTFTATNGTIATVYEAGGPLDGGIFAVTNSCAVDTQSVSDTNHALRMRVSGTSF